MKWILLLAASVAPVAAEDYVPWEADGLSIPEPLGGLQGDAERGRRVVIARDRGNCLACHVLPIPDEPAHGTVGPPLGGVASRLTEGQIRLRVVDEKMLNPETIMPGFYRHPRHFNRPLPGADRTILTAQEVEDVVAYLLTLR